MRCSGVNVLKSVPVVSQEVVSKVLAPGCTDGLADGA